VSLALEKLKQSRVDYFKRELDLTEDQQSAIINWVGNNDVVSVMMITQMYGEDEPVKIPSLVEDGDSIEASKASVMQFIRQTAHRIGG